MLAELSLIDSELRYRRLFEAAQDGILILDAKTGMIEDVNPYLIRMLGYSREEFVEKKLWEVGAFRDIEASKDAFEALQENEYIRYEDLPLKAKDGRLIQVEFVSNVYLVGDEKIIQCNIRDTTEHRRIIAALQENEKKYHDLLYQSPDGYFVIELSGNILNVNEAMCKELEFSEEEFLALNIWDIIPGRYLDEYRKKLTRVLQGESLKEATEYAVRGKNGGTHYVEVLSAPRYSGKDIIGFQGIARDVTARKRAEEALQESERKHRRLVEHLPTVVYTNAVGDAGSTLYVSPQIQTLLGYTPQEWLADPKLWLKTLHPEDIQHVLRRVAHTDQSKEPFEMEYRMIARDGRLVWVHDQIVLVKDLDGNPQFWQGIMLDITTRKHAEESLRKSESLLRATGKMAKVGGWEFDVATARVVWTEEVNEIHEVGPDYEPTISKSINFYTSEATPVIAQALQRAAAHAEPFDLELPIVTGPGKRRWAHIMGQAQHSDGKTTKVSGALQDITQRKLAEEALRESESSLQGILRSTADGILAVNKEGKTLFANERFTEMWHIPQEVMASKDDSLLLQTVLDQLSDPQTFLKVVEEINRLNEESLDTLYLKDGRIFERTSQPLMREQVSHPLLQKTELRGRVWSFRDVTHRKRIEEALRASEERLSQVWEATSDAMGLSDPQGIMLAANPAYLDLYGYTREQVVGSSFSAIFPEGAREQAVEQYRKVFASELSAPGFESAIQRSDGTGRFVEAKATFLTTNGRRTAMLSTIRDITIRKQAEKKIHQQIQHLTALRAIDQVIAANFDLKLSLSEILVHVTAELDVDAAAILTLNSSLQMLEYAAERGFRTRGIKKVPMRLSSSYAGRVVLERKSIQVQTPGDGQENLFLATPLEGEDFVFYYGVPLISKGQIKGVLEVFHRTALEPDAEWLNFLHNLASQAAIAIENATLFDGLQRSNLELTLAYDATIEGWSRALDLRDKETEGHTQRVTAMTEKLARAFGVRESELMQIRWGSLLHDIGKMGIPDGILLKPAALTDEEWVMMKKHPVFAYEMLSPIRYLQQSLDIPYCHHEKWDGTGYPRGLKGEMILLSARIFAVVDVWDALCSDRPYRAGWPEEKVRAHIRALSGIHFDPQVVDVFMHSLN